MQENIPQHIPPKVVKILNNLLEKLVKWQPQKVILFDSLAHGDLDNHFDIGLAVELNLPFPPKRKLKENWKGKEPYRGLNLPWNSSG